MAITNTKKGVGLVAAVATAAVTLGTGCQSGGYKPRFQVPQHQFQRPQGQNRSALDYESLGTPTPKPQVKGMEGMTTEPVIIYDGPAESAPKFPGVNGYQPFTPGPSYQEGQPGKLSEPTLVPVPKPIPKPSEKVPELPEKMKPNNHEGPALNTINAPLA